MERVILIAILAAAVVILARVIWRSVAGSPSRPGAPSCAGCPFDSTCGMQDRGRLNQLGGSDQDGS